MIEALNKLAAQLEDLVTIPGVRTIVASVKVSDAPIIVLMDPEAFDALDVDESIITCIREAPEGPVIGKHFDIGTVRVMTVYDVPDALNAILETKSLGGL